MTPKRIEARSAEVTAEEKAGTPRLAWTPVEDATRYRLVVLTPDGDAHWAWSGSVTSVPLGGDDEADTFGHQAGTLVWRVTAYDATGIPIAFSESFPVPEHTVQQVSEPASDSGGPPLRRKFQS